MCRWLNGMWTAPNSTLPMKPSSAAPPWRVQPIGSVDRYKIGDGGPGALVSRLKELFENIVREANASYSHWTTPVYPA